MGNSWAKAVQKECLEQKVKQYLICAQAPRNAVPIPGLAIPEPERAGPESWPGAGGDGIMEPDPFQDP
jgi:hypothetical protein